MEEIQFVVREKYDFEYQVESKEQISTAFSH